MASSTENSFKRLQAEEEASIPHTPPEIEKNVMGTARNISFVGNIVELYLSRVIDVISAFLGSPKGASSQLENGESDTDIDDTPKGNNSKRD